jgi:bifunctional DNA primase/polymerase-like protein
VSEPAFAPVNNPMDAEFQKALATLTMSLASSNQIALAARAFLGMGYQPVLVAPRDKKPVGLEWQRIVYTVDQDLESIFAAEHNIGLRLDASKLVDADLDSLWARALADAFLPKSTMVWGRKSEPAAHRAYEVKSASAVKYRKYTGLFTDTGDREVVLLERRAGAGKQTVVPPSTHKDSGETIQWVVPGPATEVDAKALCRAFDELAAASLIASVWKPSLRHRLALAIPAFLLKAGCPADGVKKLLEPVIERFDEPAEVGDRMRAIEDTISKYETDPKSVSGAKELKDLLPELAAALMAKLSDWLELRPGGGTELPVIDTRDRIWGEIHEQTFTILVDRNQLDGGPPALFQRGDRLVRVRVDEDERPKLEIIMNAALCGRLAREIVWLGPGRFGPKIIPPPDITVKDIQARSEWPGIPPLRGIVESPTFTQDGVISVTPGYQPVSRVWFHAGSVVVPDVPEVPSDADIARAKALLLDELLPDFPFVDETSRVHAVAMLLLPVVRELIDGPTPLHAVDAPTAGSGKGLLTNSVARIHTGRGMQMTTPPRTEEEWRKFLTSILMMGSPLITLDNISTKLDSGALASALTETEHQDRILGVTQMSPALPNRATWIATGNNLTASNEITRRMVWIRLMPNQEHPARRPASDFKHHPLEHWVDQNRGDLLWACLTLGQAWVARGRPPFSRTRTMGTFEAWVRVIGGILDVAGLGEHFLGNQDELFEAMDLEMQPWRDFVTAWAGQYSTRSVTVAELYDLVRQHSLLAEELPDEGKGDRSRQTRLGSLLRRHKDKVIAGWRLRSRNDGKRAVHRLERPVAAAPVAGQ